MNNKEKHKVWLIASISIVVALVLFLVLFGSQQALFGKAFYQGVDYTMELSDCYNTADNTDPLAVSCEIYLKVAPVDSSEPVLPIFATSFKLSQASIDQGFSLRGIIPQTGAEGIYDSTTGIMTLYTHTEPTAPEPSWSVPGTYLIGRLELDRPDGDGDYTISLQDIELAVSVNDQLAEEICKGACSATTTYNVGGFEVPPLQTAEDYCADFPHNCPKMDSNDGHTFYITPDGKLFGEGTGELIPGSSGPVLIPTEITGLNNVLLISLGESHVLALIANGDVYSWGSNEFGQLGDGTTANKDSPVLILTDAMAVSAGESHSLALKMNGEVFSWGKNDKGQLGDGIFIQKNVPTFVTGLTDVKEVSAGGSHSVALKWDGIVWVWGDNSFGQLASGDFNPSFDPLEVSLLSSESISAGDYIESISAGEKHSLALISTGRVMAWGDNNFGQLGDTSVQPRPSPVEVKDSSVQPIDDIISISAGIDYSIAIKSNGEILSWGLNTNNRLSSYTPLGQIQNSANPVIDYDGVELDNIQQVSAGHVRSLALDNGGYLWSWGKDSFGINSVYEQLCYGFFGNTGCVETLCSDRLDNDGDGFVDTGDSDCQDTSTLQIDSIVPPSGSGLVGNEIQFNLIGDGNIETYVWDWGDGVTQTRVFDSLSIGGERICSILDIPGSSGDPGPCNIGSHIYETVDVYPITLTATDVDGNVEILSSSYRPIVGNLLPPGTDDQVSTAYNTPITFNVLANDGLDPDGDALSVESVTLIDSSDGNAVVELDFQITFAPAIGVEGDVFMTYLLSDGTQTASIDVTVTVQPEITTTTLGDIDQTPGLDEQDGIFLIEEVVDAIINSQTLSIAWDFNCDSVVNEQDGIFLIETYLESLINGVGLQECT